MVRRLLAVALLGLAWFPGCSSDGGGGSGGGFDLGLDYKITVTPNPIQFANLAKGESATIEVLIVNPGQGSQSGTLELSQVELSGSKDFTITQPKALAIRPGEQTTMTVTYTPSDDQVDTGQLAFMWAKSSQPFIVPINAAEQVGVLTLIPSPIKFGDVSSGAPRTIGVRALNQGSSDLAIGNMSVQGSPDFHVVGVYGLVDKGCPGIDQGTSLTSPFTAKAGEGFCIDLQYNPFGGGTDSGLLQVNPPYDLVNPDQAPVATASIEGAEIGPEVTLIDDVTTAVTQELNFGSLQVGETKTLSFRIHNDGNAALKIDSVAKGVSQFDIFGDVTIDTAVAAGVEVPADPSGASDLVVSVTFAPLNSYPVTYGSIGFIEVTTNDGDEPVSYLKVTAQTAAPKLQVTPAATLDFGVVAEGPSGSTRQVTFTNVGTAKLEVSKVLIATNSTASEFTVIDTLEDPMVIEPGQYRTVGVQFVNKGGPEGEVVEGALGFASNDPEGATIVNLRATRAKKAFCKLKLDPATVNFGTIGYGYEKTMTLNITNVGSAPCSPFSVNVFDGANGLFGAPATCKAKASDNSKQFVVVNEPPAIKDLLQPGQTLPLQVKYVPEGSIFSIGDIIEFAGLVQVTMLDYANPSGTDPFTIITEPPGAVGATIGCNLIGKAGTANIAAIPGELAFDLTTVGCSSKTEDVKIYNTGKAPIQVCDVAFEGCGPEFKLKNVPPIPPCVNGSGGYSLTQGAPMLLGVSYVPQDTNADGCSLVVYSNDKDTPGLYIPLSGAGTYDTEQTDEYTQLSGQEVDVLFITDNSGSMSEEQGSLGNNIGSFVSQATAWQTDYHIGVVSTDVDDANTMRGWLQTNSGSQPRFFTNGTGVNGFKDTVTALGTNGSGTEQGFEAARLALTFPLTAGPANPPKTCSTDTDCVKPQACVKSVLQSGQKFCAGPNAEFLRPDAVLELVFVSDEEEQSSGDLGFYVDFFKNIKGFANTGLFHAHAIVGDHNTGCSSNAGQADAGERYIELAQQTGGKIKSICDSAWAAILTDIGQIAFGLKVEFFLSRPPVPDTIEVKIDNKVCAVGQGWQYIEEANAILFDENGPCMPKENQKIKIHYDVYCYPQ